MRRPVCNCTCNVHQFKSGVTLIGLPDGGVTYIFEDAPPYHRTKGWIEVSFSAKTIRHMKKFSKRGIAHG